MHLFCRLSVYERHLFAIFGVCGFGRLATRRVWLKLEFENRLREVEELKMKLSATLVDAFDVLARKTDMVEYNENGPRSNMDCIELDHYHDKTKRLFSR